MESYQTAIHQHLLEKERHLLLAWSMPLSATESRQLPCASLLLALSGIKGGAAAGTPKRFQWKISTFTFYRDLCHWNCQQLKQP